MPERPPHLARSPLAVLVAGCLALAAAGCGTASTADTASTASADTAGGAPAGAAAAAAPAAATFPLTIDSCGRTVTLPTRPQRVVTIGTSAVALLHAAGAADRIVARSGEFGAPLPPAVAPAVSSAKILDESDPSLESIVGAEPDLVVGYGLFKTTPESLAAAGIPSVTVTGECGHDDRPASLPSGMFAAITADITTYGRVFGSEQTAAAAVSALRGRIDAATAAAADAPAQTAAGVYFWGGKLSVTGTRNMLHDQLTALGFTDAFADLGKGFAEIGIEALIAKDPQVIVLSYGSDGDTYDTARQTLLALPGADRLSAVRTGRIYPLPAASRGPDPAAVDGLEALAEATGRG